MHHPLLTAIENTSFTTWIRESQSIWAYPMMIFLHSVGLSIVVGLNAAIDLRLLGFAARIPVAPLEKLYPLMWFGFWINAASGVALLVSDISTFAVAPLFYIKLGVIALSLANLIAIRRVVFNGPSRTGPITPSARMLAVTSLVFWTAAITAGRLTAYIGPAVALKGIDY
jgi:hypothetical protein